MKDQPTTAAKLRKQARLIRDMAAFAQGRTRQDELSEARELERKAYELEQQAEQTS